MPRLSDSMEEGTIVRWLKRHGESVTRGDEIVEVETDKANMPYEADADGVLFILAGEGETVTVGDVIARIGDAGDSASIAETAPVASVAAATASGNGTGARPRASPLARRIAQDLGVDLTHLAGTGPGGRIVKADVQTAERPAPAAPEQPVTAAEPHSTRVRGEPEVRELTRLQRTVARRTSEAKATVPEFTLTTVVDMEEAIGTRNQLKDLVPAGAPAPSYNDMIIRACALTLREHPRVNASFRDDTFVLHHAVNVGVAVAGDDSLVVPVVRDADRKGLAAIASETRSLAAAVRDGSIAPAQLDGGTFSVSNLGMFGVDEFTAVINLPQAAILAVGAMTPEPIARDGAVAVRHMMRLTLTCDHRILYGADAARFLRDVRARLERPLSMLL